MDKEQFKIWLAGFIDGEGYIGTNPAGCIRLFIVNTDKYVLDNIKKFYHGNVYKRKNLNKRWKVRYSFEVSSNYAKIIFDDILPFSIIKRKQIELALEVQYLNEKLNLANRLNNLKHKRSGKGRFLPNDSDLKKKKKELVSMLASLTKRGVSSSK